MKEVRVEEWAQAHPEKQDCNFRGATLPRVTFSTESYKKGRWGSFSNATPSHRWSAVFSLLLHKLRVNPKKAIPERLSSRWRRWAFHVCRRFKRKTQHGECCFHYVAMLKACFCVHVCSDNHQIIRSKGRQQLWAAEWLLPEYLGYILHTKDMWHFQTRKQMCLTKHQI